MRYSDKWKNWIALIDAKTCPECKIRNGKIYDISEIVSPSPPLHPRCRCRILKMKSMFAGEATNNGVNGADWYIKYMGRLPEYYITKKEAKKRGWIMSRANLSNVAPGCMVYGIYYNDDGKLPSASQRIWYEADINYTEGYRNMQRILFSSDGLIFVTYDHYETFIEVR